MSLFLFASAAYAAKPVKEMTDIEIQDELIVQQLLYDEQVAAANNILTLMVSGGHTITQLKEFQINLNAARAVYKQAAITMLELKIEQFERAQLLNTGENEEVYIEYEIDEAEESEAVEEVTEIEEVENTEEVE